MREMEFRAYDTEYNRWFRPEDICIQGDGTIWIERRGSDYGDIIDTIDGTEQAAIIEQFTGLRDKNGNKIFEGDIVKYGNDAPDVVVFMECCFYTCLKHNKHILVLKVFDNINKYEIIGNIHENPDLLNKY
jgi:uncharacterized phage protein (TIGR01671 family)